jgi:hypothetical protein
MDSFRCSSILSVQESVVLLSTASTERKARKERIQGTGAHVSSDLAYVRRSGVSQQEIDGEHACTMVLPADATQVQVACGL